MSRIFNVTLKHMCHSILMNRAVARDWDWWSHKQNVVKISNVNFLLWSSAVGP